GLAGPARRPDQHVVSRLGQLPRDPLMKRAEGERQVNPDLRRRSLRPLFMRALVKRQARAGGAQRAAVVALGTRVLRAARARMPPGPGRTAPPAPAGRRGAGLEDQLDAGVTAGGALLHQGVQEELEVAKAGDAPVGEGFGQFVREEPPPGEKARRPGGYFRRGGHQQRTVPERVPARSGRDRKSTRLNSSHVKISYAVF